MVAGGGQCIWEEDTEFVSGHVAFEEAVGQPSGATWQICVGLCLELR